MAVYKDDAVVRHVPYNLAPNLSRFLARDVNKAFAEVTGERVNQRAGYGLKIPCVYRIYATKTYVDKMKDIRLHDVLWTSLDPGADTGGVLWVLKHSPLSQDNIQVSIDIWLSNQL